MQNFPAFAFFPLIRLAGAVISKSGTRRVMSTDTSLTKAPVRRRPWLPLRVPKDANVTRSLLSGAKLLNASKSRLAVKPAKSGFSSKTERIWDLTLTPSSRSLPIFQTGKPTTTNRLSAGHHFAANNHLCITNQARRDAGFCVGKNKWI